MELLKHRGLAIGCLGYLLLLYVSYYVHFAITVFVASLGISFIIFLSICYKNARVRQTKRLFFTYIPLCFFLILACISSLLVFKNDKSYYDLCDENEYIIEGKVDSTIYSSDYLGVYVLDISSVNDSKHKISVIARDELGISYENAIVTAKARFSRPANNYYQDESIILECEITEYLSICDGSFDLKDHFKNANEFLDNIYKNQLNSDTYPLISALFLGNRDNLDPSLERDFSRLGISHVLSLSGMHVAIIITMLGFVIEKSIRSKHLSVILMCIIIFAFVGISGFSSSAMRAGLMQIIFFLLHFLWRRSDSITSLFVAVFIICLLNPYNVFSFSLLLSFLAMLGCVASSRFIRKRRFIFRRVRKKPLRYVLLTFITTVFVIFITVPLTAAKFGTFSLLTYPANLIIVPFVNILIYLAPLVLIFSPVPYLSDGISFICEWLTFGITKSCSYISSLSGIVIPVKNLVQILGAILLFASIVIAIVISRRKIKYSYYTAILGVFLFIVGSILIPISRANSSYVTTVSSSSNDMIFVESKGDLTIVDITSHSSGKINPYNEMTELGYTEIDTYIVCDYSYRISDYLDELTARAIVKQVYLPEPLTEKDFKYLEGVSEIFDKRGVKYDFYISSLTVNNLSLDFCDKATLGDSVKRAVCFSLLLDNKRYTYLGASSYELLSYFPTDYIEASNVVAFGSYGPSYSIDFDYPVSNIDYFIFLGNSYDFASESIQLKSIDRCTVGNRSVIKIKR